MSVTRRGARFAASLCVALAAGVVGVVEVPAAAETSMRPLGGDGVREIVPPDPDEDTSDPVPGVPSDDEVADDDAPDLEDPDEGVEREGSGGGELAPGRMDRAIPIAVALVAIVGALGALVAAQRRWERSRP